jgi:DNA-binding LytR/AlgR family response regulator
MKIVIAEDEQPQRIALLAMLNKLLPDPKQITVCEDGLSALESMQKNPDVAFLDIRMPGMNGLEVARSAAPETRIVFITAYDEYAVKAFDAGAVDYLLKPVTEERLSVCLQRLRSSAASTTHWQTVLDSMQKMMKAAPSNTMKWITASVGDSVKMLAVQDVLFFQAQDKYVRVVTASEEAIIRMSLKELIVQLDSDEFWRVHRSAVVRVSAIDRVHKDQLGHYNIRLKNHAETLPISAAFQSRFRGM